MDVFIMYAECFLGEFVSKYTTYMNKKGDS